MAAGADGSEGAGADVEEAAPVHDRGAGAGGAEEQEQMGQTQESMVKEHVQIQMAAGADRGEGAGADGAGAAPIYERRSKGVEGVTHHRRSKGVEGVTHHHRRGRRKCHRHRHSPRPPRSGYSRNQCHSDRRRRHVLLPCWARAALECGLGSVGLGKEGRLPSLACVWVVRNVQE
jgi:hypothetical protein